MKVVLVDSFNLAFRAHHTHSTLTTSTNFPTGALYGFLNMAKAAHKYGDNLIFCWEGGYALSRDAAPPQPTWRKQIKSQQGEEYKANRTPNDHSMTVHKQVPLIYKAIEILKYPQLSVPGLEGDDIIGVISSRLADNPKVDHIYILSTDRDFFQCINSKITVIRPEKGASRRYTAKLVKSEFGVMPEVWDKYKAFCGDGTDGYHGIPGCGPKNAAVLTNLGGDPTLSWDKQPKHVRNAYAKFESHWKTAMDCFVMSHIPRIPRYVHFPKESRKLLLEQLELLPSKLTRKFTKDELDEAVYRFTKFASKYEMSSLVAERNAYFATAQLV